MLSELHFTHTGIGYRADMRLELPDGPVLEQTWTALLLEPILPLKAWRILRNALAARELEGRRGRA